MKYSPSLYIHIPFCMAKCSYCDFFSKPCVSVKDEYIDAVLAQCRFLSEKYKVHSWKTVYVGGGTPSLLSPIQLEKLLSGVTDCVPDASTMEVTVEMNPETLTAEKLQVLEKCGATRLSLGIQSMNQKALDAVGRHCSRENVLSSLKIVREHWKGQLNLDSIAGLPHQNTDEFLSSLGEIISYAPDHVSLYSLMVEEGTVLEEKISSGKLEWDSDEADSQWLLGKQLLEENGYCQYEVSNFARDGMRSSHNLSYWRQQDYLALGSGGCGTVYDFDLGKAYRYTNTADVEEYISFWNGIAASSSQGAHRVPACGASAHGTASAGTSAGEINPEMKEWPVEYEELDLETMEYEFLMMGLRTLEGVSVSQYRKRFSLLEPWKGDLYARLGVENGLWHDLEVKGHGTKVQGGFEGSGEHLALTEEGLLFLNSILLEL